MTNENVRLFFHDKFMAKTILRIIPRWIKPNHITVLRFLLTPIVLWFVWIEQWPIAIPLFMITAFTDAIDGSLARTRKQITMWGTVADPVADKILIGSVAVLFIARHIHPVFAGLIVAMEGIVIFSAVWRFRSRGYMSANTFGKIKMFLQVSGVFFLLLSEIVHAPWLVLLAIISFSFAILFAFLSALTYGI